MEQMGINTKKLQLKTQDGRTVPVKPLKQTPNASAPAKTNSKPMIAKTAEPKLLRPTTAAKAKPEVPRALKSAAKPVATTKPEPIPFVTQQEESKQ